MFISIYLSIYLSPYLFIPKYFSLTARPTSWFISIYQSIYPRWFICISLSVYLPVYRTSYLSIYLSISVHIYLSTYLHRRLFCISRSICLTVHPTWREVEWSFFRHWGGLRFEYVLWWVNIIRWWLHIVWLPHSCENTTRGRWNAYDVVKSSSETI